MISVVMLEYWSWDGDQQIQVIDNSAYVLIATVVTGDNVETG